MSVGPDPEKLYTVAEVADLFSVTGETVRDWIKSGKIKGVKINGYWRVARSEVIRFGNSKY